MARLDESLSDLRRKKRMGVPLTRREHFRLLASKCARKWARTGWSSAELRVKKVLDELGLIEKKDYFHNFKLHNEFLNQFFSLDFLILPRKTSSSNRPVVLEVSPAIWHTKLGNTEEKDARKEEWLERLGFRYFELNDEYLGHKRGDKARLRERIRNLLRDLDRSPRKNLKGKDILSKGLKMPNTPRVIE